MTDHKDLKAWVHWKKREINLSEDEALFVKAVEDVISQAGMAPKNLQKEVSQLRFQLRKASQREAELIAAVQEHAEGGNIDNYLYLSDKLELILNNSVEGNK